MKKRVVALLCFWFIVVCAIAQTRFALLTDIHVVPGNNNEKFLEQVVDEINQSDLPFVVITGDLTNEGSDEQLYNVKRIFDGLKKPYYIIPGNHEMNCHKVPVKLLMIFGEVTVSVLKEIVCYFWALTVGHI